MVILSKRLKAIYDMVPNSVVADIGSDHGKLMIALFKDGNISHGYAIENKIGPYNRLVSALKKEEIIDNVVPLFSDGITELPESVNTIVIAGMGGKAIVEILKKSPEKLKNIQTIIVDAHSCIPYVRKEINNMGYIIADEQIVKDEDVFYEIIKFVKSDIGIYTDQDLEFGPILRNEKSALFKEKYNSIIKEINSLMKNANLPKTRYDFLKAEKEKIKRVL